MAKLLGQVAVGSIVKLKESGVPANYIVVHQGKPGELYDNSCDGTWLLRQNALDGFAQWGYGNNNKYAESYINRYLNDTVLKRFDPAIQEAINQIKIPYMVDGYVLGSGASGLSCKIFLLSMKEVGFTAQDCPYISKEGSLLSYFISGTGSEANQKRALESSGTDGSWWLRSPSNAAGNGAEYAFYVTDSGIWSHQGCANTMKVRPALVCPGTLFVSDDDSVYSVPNAPTLTVPSESMQGQPIPINWTASTGADSYQLQRKADSGEWEAIYTGANLSFEDIAGVWATVQYQVAAGLNGEYGEYATSAAIPVISASALVISGSDEDLGTITADIPYTVTSDTGNQITHTLTVNGVQFATATEASGVAHSIPVMELPTGTGTIVITASVQATSGPVTATRTWTYTKAPISFPDAAGVGVLQKNGQNFLPATLAELVRTNPFWGGTLDKALEMMTGVALNGAQIEVGSYKGTGTYGGGNPNSLTFGFYVLFLVVMKRNGSSSQMPNQSSYANRVSGQFYAIRNAELLGCTAQNPGNSGSTAPFIQFSWGDNSVTWFAPNSNNPEDQFNGVGQTYDYLAFGKKE